MMAYAELHMPSLLTSIIFLSSIDYHNDDDTRLMKIQSHGTNSEWRWNGERIRSPPVTDQMEISIFLRFC